MRKTSIWFIQFSNKKASWDKRVPINSTCSSINETNKHCQIFDRYLPFSSYHSHCQKIWHLPLIYTIIAKNIHYLLWNRGAWRFFHDTYLTIKVQGIRCTHHLHDSCPLTDVNPHFTAPGCRYYFKTNSWWPIVTSSTHGPAVSYCDVTMAHCCQGYLWTHDVEVDAS